jgi:DNA-binding GntR family transcriptional regulator
MKKPRPLTGDRGTSKSKRGTRGHVLEHVYNALIEALNQGKFQPGQRLLEADICDWLGISRTPVREALRRLQAQGLLEHLPGGGVTVSLHDFRAVSELFTYREILEGSAARLAAKHADEVEINLLKALVKIQMELPDNPTIHERENRLFHKHLYQASHNQFLLKSLLSLQESIALLGRTTLSVPGRIESSIREHEEIVSAIAAHDQQRAEELVRVHIRAAYEARVRLITESLEVAARQPIAGDTQIAISPYKSRQPLPSAETTSKKRKGFVLDATTVQVSGSSRS